jgi:hypothetical protein
MMPFNNSGISIPEKPWYIAKGKVPVLHKNGELSSGMMENRVTLLECRRCCDTRSV